MGQEDKVREALGQALRNLVLERGDAFAARIKNLVFANLERGRVSAFLDGDTAATAADYVNLVVTQYDAQHDYVQCVQQGRDATIWEPLFEKLQKWAYNLIRKRLQTNPHRERIEHAVNCAADAGAAIVNSYFPYDTAFDAWMYVLLNYTVNKYVRGLPGFKEEEQTPHVPLDRWPEWSDNLADPRAERALTRYELQQMLAQAIDRLPPGQQEVIALLFSPQAYSYNEIAEKTGRTFSALYKAKFDALENLRALLADADYIVV